MDIRLPINCPDCNRRKKEALAERLPGMTDNYTVRFLRDDMTCKTVTGLPSYRGAVVLAQELVGGRIVSSQVRRSRDGKLLAQFLDPTIEGIMDDFFAFAAAVHEPE